MYINIVKRLGDVFASLVLLILFSPLIVALTILLSMANNGKPFFLQKRPGKKGKIFTIIKFKTMNDKKDDKGNLLPDVQRITRIGGFVRAYSLDELVQLINVLFGQMSLIGPRPLLVDYLPLYNKYQARRHEVKPGITGWAQVNGRNAISWDQRFKLDVWYVDNVSFSLDLKIILRTVMKILEKDGVYTDDKQTMPVFTGNSN